MNHQRFFMVIGLSVAVLASCGGGPAATGTPTATGTPGATSTSAPSSTTPAGGATTVNVTVQEFSVLPDVASAPAGDITFSVTNTGPDDVHEFVIIQTDLAPDALPTDANGAVEEEGEGMTVIDEIEDIAVGANEELTVTLAAGSYALICNIFDESENEAHYQMGMYTAFTVE
ncbi:MAG TPA: hypothetical protein VIF08_01140 [Candidatus Limnocylindrales bacterium]